MSTSILAPRGSAATIDAICSHLQSAGRPDGDLLCTFARIFFANVPATLLAERSVVALSALTAGAWDFLRRARPEEVNVELTNPEDEGWSAPATILRAEVGDRPFIVDTIREYLGAEKLAIHYYLYPVFRVVRDEAGEIVSIGPDRGGEEGEGSLEALDYVEISPINDPTRCEEVRREIARRLGDVVAATTDFGAMRDALEHTAVLVDGYAASRTSIGVAGRLVGSGRVRAVVLHALHIPPALVEEASRANLAGVIGRQVFGPALIDTLVEIATTDSGAPVVVKTHDQALTERERNILILIGEGRSNDEIAHELAMSVNTVKASARSVYRKLGVRNRTNAAMLAHRNTSASMQHPVAPTDR